MSQAISFGTPSITVRYRRNHRAKRFILRVSSAGHEPLLTIPPGTSLRRARQFLLDNEAWLRGRLAVKIDRVSVGPGMELPFRGALVRIELGAGRRMNLAGGVLQVPGPVETTGVRVRAYFREAARERFFERSRFYAKKVDRTVGRITLRDTRSRWGSCSSNGNLMYSWRLIMAPDEVLDYVAAHEVAHLVEMNHSKRFWDVVHNLKPDCQMPRDWLRISGGQLHRWEFAAP